MHKILAKTLFIGKQLIYLPSCHSTNDVAGEMVASGLLHDGGIVITSNQTAGKGQRGNSWESAPQTNITMSVVLKPVFLPVAQQFALNMVVSLALYDLLRPYSAAVSIKWPNDLLIERKKVAGILIENSIRGTQLGWSVIGIGLNVNQTSFSHPNAGSLRLVTQQQLNLQDLLEQLALHLEKYYFQLKSGKIELLRTNYCRQLYLINTPTQFTLPDGQRLNGSIRDVSPDGRLQVETASGMQSFLFKELIFPF
jgi:BirA family transcriptional regulator, biotin operon repressor / biotin---[acetyl-CoA-carboxylase] ligase